MVGYRRHLRWGLRLQSMTKLDKRRDEQSETPVLSMVEFSLQSGGCLAVHLASRGKSHTVPQ